MYKMYVCIIVQFHLFIISDILVNNAGIIRDKSLGKLTDMDWGKSMCNRVYTNSCYYYSFL